MSEADEAWRAMVTVGRIVRPHGNRGHVVIDPETDRAEERFAVGAALYAKRSGALERLTVGASRSHDNRWVVGFEHVTSIDGAETLRGLELKIPADALPALGVGGYYVHDLLGCRMETVAGELIGTVRRVDLGAGTPLLAVSTTRGEVLIPLAEPICRRVDVTDKVIVIDPPEGLIELNRTRR